MLANHVWQVFGIGNPEGCGGERDDLILACVSGVIFAFAITWAVLTERIFRHWHFRYRQFQKVEHRPKEFSMSTRSSADQIGKSDELARRIPELESSIAELRAELARLKGDYAQNLANLSSEVVALQADLSKLRVEVSQIHHSQEAEVDHRRSQLPESESRSIVRDDRPGFPFGSLAEPLVPIPPPMSRSGDPNNTMILYNCTSKGAAQLILADGAFKPAVAGLFGAGIYFAGTRKSAQGQSMHGATGVIIETRVYLGFMLEVPTGHNVRVPLTYDDVRKYGCNSVHGHAGNGDLYVIYDPNNVLQIISVDPVSSESI
jgi:hypothetical protein